MYIIKELINDISEYRKYFLYIDEIYDFKNNTIDKTRLEPYHIIMINHYYFGITALPSRRKERDWDTIRVVVIDFISKINNKLCLIMCDCHTYSFLGGIKTIAMVCNEHKINYLMTMYNQNKEIQILEKHMNELAKDTKIIQMNNMIREDIFKDYGFEKCYDIFYYGAKNGYYPLRRKLLKLFRTKRFKDNFSIIVTEYREYTEEELAKMLNKSYLCVATMSSFEYLVKKYFEISASKSLILGDMPKQGYEIFKNNYVKISKNMSDDQIFNAIKRALNHKDCIATKTNNNYNIVREQHIIPIFHEKLYNKMLMHK